jgi:hypothetical protein
MKMFADLPDFTESFWYSQAQTLLIEKDLKAACTAAKLFLKLLVVP